MIKGLVSTIIPVFNRALFLQEAAASVFAQTYRPIEIIIIDDGSTDETAKVADDLEKVHAEIKAIHKNNTGPGPAREAGRLEAKGEFIQYLDSDDLLITNKFTLQVKGLIEHPECGVAYGKTRYRYSDGQLESKPWKRSGESIPSMFPSFLQSRWWDTPNPLYRATVCSEAGAWSNLSLEEDWEYDCRIAALGIQLHYVPEFICEVRDHNQHRLCRGDALDPRRLRERAKAHAMIYGHAERAGILPECDEMRHFARELFLLSRQCGAAGLADESKQLYVLARKASGDKGGNTINFIGYKLLATIFGWKTIGRFSCYLDSFRGL